MTPLKRFEYKDVDMLTGFLQGIILLAALSLIGGLIYLVLRSSLSNKIRDLVDIQIKTIKKNLRYNKTLTVYKVQFTMQAVNCVNRMKGAENTEAVLMYCVLLGIPVAMGAFLYLNYERLDSREYRVKFESSYLGVSVLRG
jgi:hypothetical protein